MHPQILLHILYVLYVVSLKWIYFFDTNWQIHKHKHCTKWNHEFLLSRANTFTHTHTHTSSVFSCFSYKWQYNGKCICTKRKSKSKRKNTKLIFYAMNMTCKCVYISLFYYALFSSLLISSLLTHTSIQNPKWLRFNCSNIVCVCVCVRAYELKASICWEIYF